MEASDFFGETEVSTLNFARSAVTTDSMFESYRRTEAGSPPGLSYRIRLIHHIHLAGSPSLQYLYLSFEARLQWDDTGRETDFEGP